MRECPNCGMDELEENTLRTWKCANCEVIYDEEWLDDGEEESL